jgi:regulator of sigma E protease
LIRAKLFKDNVLIEVQRDSSTVALQTIPAESVEYELGPNLGRELGFLPFEKSVVVRAIGEGSAAASAGFETGDKLISVAGTPVLSSAQFTELVKKRPEEQISILVERAGQEIALNATPARVELEDGSIAGRLGLSIGGESVVVSNQLSIWDSAVEGTGRMIEVSVFSLAALGKMVTGDLSWNHLSGPVSCLFSDFWQWFLLA